MTRHTTEDVLAHLRISRVYLRRAMLATPPEIARPWVCYGGTGSRVRYSWRPIGEVDRWWEEVCAWRRSSDAATGGGSDGETSTAPHGPGSAPARDRRASSSSKSKKQLPAGDDGSLSRLRALLSSGT